MDDATTRTDGWMDGITARTYGWRYGLGIDEAMALDGWMKPWLRLMDKVMAVAYGWQNTPWLGCMGDVMAHKDEAMAPMDG